MELSVIQTTSVSLVSTGAAVAFAFGVFSSEVEQVVVSAAGTLIGLGFALFSELERHTKTSAAIALHDEGALRRIARR